MFDTVAPGAAAVDDEPELSAGARLADELAWTLSMLVELDRPAEELTLCALVRAAAG